jgi:hypothetical protein
MTVFGRNAKRFWVDLLSEMDKRWYRFVVAAEVDIQYSLVREKSPAMTLGRATVSAAENFLVQRNVYVVGQLKRPSVSHTESDSVGPENVLIGMTLSFGRGQIVS